MQELVIYKLSLFGALLRYKVNKLINYGAWKPMIKCTNEICRLAFDRRPGDRRL